MSNILAEDSEESQQYPQLLLPDGLVLFPDKTLQQRLGGDLARVQFADGTIYQGQLDSVSQPHGVGLYEGPGVRIFGPFDEQQITGQAIIQFENGSAVQGAFRNSIACGFGRAFEAVHGLYYAGEFSGGQPDGLGCMAGTAIWGVLGDGGASVNLEASAVAAGLENSDFNMYLGYFQEGRFHGRGVGLCARPGAGRQRFNRHEGYYVNGRREGQGALFLANGDQLVGQFKDGAKEGLFVIVREQGQLELLFYEKNTATGRFQSQKLYIPKPYELRCLDVPLLDRREYDLCVLRFKALEAGEQTPPAAHPVVDTVFKACRFMTIPLQIGLTEDLRVCQPYLSEAIAEAARMATNQEGLTEDVVHEVEAIKSLVINNYELLQFLFNVYKAREARLVRVKRTPEYEDSLAPLVALFQEKCVEAERQLKAERDVVAMSPVIMSPKARAQTDLSQMSQPRASLQRNASELSMSYYPVGRGSMDSQNSGQQNTSLEEQTSSKQKSQAELSMDQLQTSPIRTIPHDENKATASTAAQQVVQFCNETQARLPPGDTPERNGLIQKFIEALDTQNCLSKNSIVAFFRDMATALNKPHVVLNAQQYLEILAQQFSKPSDSFLAQLTFRVLEPYFVTEQTFGLIQFIMFILQAFPMFECTSATQFVTQWVLPFAKYIIVQLQQICQDQRIAEEIFNVNPDIISGGKSKRHDELEQAATRSKAERQSQHSYQSKQTKGAMAIPALPKVLVRDASYQLSDIEQLFMRLQSIDKKLLKAFETNRKHERGVLHQKLIYEEVEAIITEYYGVSSTQYVHPEKLTLLQFLSKVFSQLHEIVGLQAFEQDPQVYIDALQPFLQRFLGYDVYGLKQQRFLAKSAGDAQDPRYLKQQIAAEHFPIEVFIELVQHITMTDELVRAVLTCVILRSPLIDRAEENNEGEEQSEEKTGSILSSANFGTQSEAPDAAGDPTKMLVIGKDFDAPKVKDIVGEFFTRLVEIL